MIVFKKLPDGMWQKSGEILPTEHTYTIAVDAENRERMTYPCKDAIQEVENRIKKGTTAYRFELAMPPASQLKHKAKPKAAAKSAPKAKKETGHQRRLRLIREGKCTACGKCAPRKGRRECKTCAEYYADWAKAAAKKGGRK
jgi:hypothetical protein